MSTLIVTIKPGYLSGEQEIPTVIETYVPTGGFYRSFLSVFNKLSVKVAIRRLDEVHDGEWDYGDTNEEGRVAYWENIKNVWGGDEGLLGVVARVMAGDTLGSEDEGEALAFGERYFFGTIETFAPEVGAVHVPDDPNGIVLQETMPVAPGYRRLESGVEQCVLCEFTNGDHDMHPGHECKVGLVEDRYKKGTITASERDWRVRQAIYVRQEADRRTGEDLIRDQEARQGEAYEYKGDRGW